MSIFNELAFCFTNCGANSILPLCINLQWHMLPVVWAAHITIHCWYGTIDSCWKWLGNLLIMIWISQPFTQWINSIWNNYFPDENIIVVCENTFVNYKLLSSHFQKKKKTQEKGEKCPNFIKMGIEIITKSRNSRNSCDTVSALKSVFFCLFLAILQLGHCHWNSPLKLGCQKRRNFCPSPEMDQIGLEILCSKTLIVMGNFNSNVLAQKMPKKAKDQTLKH